MAKIRRLFKITVRVTGQCNRGCPDCYDDARMRKFPKEFSATQESALISEVESLVLHRVKVLVHITGGGEPLLYARLARLITRLLEAGTEVTFTTSGCTGFEKENLTDKVNLSKLSEIQSPALGPILSTKVTLPKWQEKFRYSVVKLAQINGFVTVRQTDYGDYQLLVHLTGLGFKWVERDAIGPMPPAFYRKDLIVPGEDSRVSFFQNDEGITLQVISHRVIRTGRAKRNDRATAQNVSMCPYLERRARPYLDIWPNGAIYPCFIIGPEIQELSLGTLGEIGLEEALLGDNFEERKRRFEKASPGTDCICDRCRDTGKEHEL